MKIPFSKSVLFAGAALLLAASLSPAGEASDLPPYKNPALSPEERAADLLSRMTLEEKVAYCGGVNKFFIREIPRLGIPAISMRDGPVGVHGEGTAFPPTIAVAASFDTNLAYRMGEAIGRECRAVGVHIILGPGMNIIRSPIMGRAGEYFSEDPCLTSRMSVDYIKGVQSQGVMACAKHYIGNELDFARTSTDSRIDERTLREIYLPPFEASIRDGRVATIMGAYNHVNGQASCADPLVLQAILREDLGFDGFVMSDWGAGNGPADIWAKGPLDLAMPEGMMGKTELVLPLIEAGKIDPKAYDVKVGNILRSLIRFGFLDRQQQDGSLPKKDPASRNLALQISREGTVLLKNENNVLPLLPEKIHSLAVIGPNAEKAPDATPYPTGLAGSSSVDCPKTVSIAQGIRNLAGREVRVVVVPDHMRTLFTTTAYEHFGPDGKIQPGLQAAYFKNREFSGKPDLERVDKDLNFSHGWRVKNWLNELRPFSALSVRWTGQIRPEEDGSYCFAKESNLGLKVWLDGKLIMDDDKDYADTHWVHPTGGVVRDLQGGKTYDLKIEYVNRIEVAHMAGLRFGWGLDEPSAELEAARSCDAVVACMGYGYMTEGEGFDRTWELPYGQAEVLKKVSAINPRTIVVATGGGAFETGGWIDRVPALVQPWYLAESGGQVVADILFGKVNPSGKLPVTFAKRWEDNPSSPYFHIDWDSKAGFKPIDYKEGLFVGYRGFDQAGTEPLFPFGHGLSYSTFDFSDMKILPCPDGTEGIVVSCRVTNSSSRAGAEVAQLYVGDRRAPVPRPPLELKGFQRIELQPGESRQVQFPLSKREFAFYDVPSKGWRNVPGPFELAVGASSRDIRLKGKYDAPWDGPLTSPSSTQSIHP